MNRAVLNAIAINGNLYVRASSLASVAVNASLPITYVIRIGGTATIALQSTNAIYKRVSPSAEADIVVGADIETPAVAATMGEGDALVSVDAGIASKVEYRPAMDAAIEFQSQVESRIASSQIPSGTATAVISAQLDATVATTHFSSGIARMRLESEWATHVGKSVPVISLANIIASGSIEENLKAVGGGKADLEFRASGSGRIGDKVYGSGDAVIAMYASGHSTVWRQVQGSGKAEIHVKMKAERFGIKPVPIDYRPADAYWSLKVPADSWLFVVQPDRQFLGGSNENRRTA